LTQFSLITNQPFIKTCDGAPTCGGW